MVEIEFGTDGIRGRAGEYPLTPEGAAHVGRAIGRQFSGQGDYIMVGHDTRESSPVLAAGVALGIMSIGVDVGHLEVLPTPALSHVTREYTAAAGVMITASHNPYHDNGIKVFDGTGNKLTDEVQGKISELLQQDLPGAGYGKLWDGRGLTSGYKIALVRQAGERLRGEVVLDAANGAAYMIGPAALELCGLRLETIGVRPNGRNINDQCGALHTEKVQKKVRQLGLMAGIALDGDADRVIMIDESGEVLNGDHIMYINAVMENQPGIVATTMSNIGLEKALAEKGIAFHRTDVGDRSVMQGLARTGLELGGEQSGHIIFRDAMPSGDGLLAAIKTLRNVSRSGKPLSEWRGCLTLLPQKIISIPVNDKNLVMNNAYIQERVAQVAEELGVNGRIILRPAGTEPVVRLMVESERAEDLAASLESFILQAASL